MSPVESCTRRRFLERLGGIGVWGALAGAKVHASSPAVAPRAVALAAFARHQAAHPLTHYTGILSLQGLARLAVAEQDAVLLARARAELLPFVRGERVFKCNFPNYLVGGNGTAFLFRHGHLPEAAEAVRRQARVMMTESPRSHDGILTRPDKRGTDAVFIDAAFAVCPFLACAGRALQELAWLEEAFQQANRLFALLRNPANGLLHQARGFSQPGTITGDHWSRGNGWGLLAVVELIEALPDEHPRRPAAIALARDLLEACLRVQDAEGRWHQELTLESSYAETSGSGLILHALGQGLLGGWMPARHRGAFDRGLAAYRSYIEPDGSVRNTCIGCLSPGAGRIADYVARPAARNDPHAFGPVVLAFGTAAQLARKGVL
jgi:unsaturated rhamnogalacturonyl hydrolase